ncbi:MAG TPA: hypothetical protein VGT41_02330 [Candidatus Babeliales bacterium]|nr:hypothetical protein [Candidatus Babeliales bacterium]
MMPMPISPKKRVATLISFILFLISFAAGVFFLIKQSRYKNHIIDQAFIQAHDKTTICAQQLDNLLQLLIPQTASLAEKLSATPLTPSEIEAILKKKPADIFGFGVAYLPDNTKTNNNAYAPYYVEKEGVNTAVDLSKMSGYIYYEQEWFKALLTKEQTFFGPFTDFATGEDVIGVATPFYVTDPHDNSKKIGGIVYVTQSMNHLQHILTTLLLGQNGYWFSVANNEIILTHPREKLLYSRTSIDDFAKETANEATAEIIRHAIRGKADSTSFNNTVTGDESWLIAAPIPIIKGALCGVFDKKEIPLDDDLMRQGLIRICMIFLTSFLFLIISVLFYTNHTIHVLLFSSAYSTVCLLTSIALIWSIINKYPFYKDPVTPITDKQQLNKFLTQKDNIQKKSNSTLSLAQLHTHKSIGTTQNNYVPTGIFITTIQLIGPNQLQIIGYVWQQYHKELHKNLSQGFIFPQATKDNDIEEIHRNTEGELETILWRVNTTLYQDARYQKYPFDVKSFQIQLWHKDFEKNVTLIPDFDAYNIINIGSKPGLRPSITLAGYDIQNSFFGYKTSSYRTSFGLYAYGPFGLYKRITKSETPELHFNITAKRSLNKILVIDLIPVIVIALLLFIMLLISTERNILSAAASLFFSTIIAQIRFREGVPPYGLVYFETFYFILYIALFIVTLFVLLRAFKIVSEKHHLVLALLFWPILLGSILGITLLYQY